MLENMTVKKYQAIDLILQGKNDGEVADAIGVTRQTVNYWKNRDVFFIAELNSALQAQQESSAELTNSLVNKAKEVLLEQLEVTSDPTLALDILKAVKPVRRTIGKTDKIGMIIDDKLGTRVDRVLGVQGIPSDEEMLELLEEDPFNQLKRL